MMRETSRIARDGTDDEKRKRSERKGRIERTLPCLEEERERERVVV